VRENALVYRSKLQVFVSASWAADDEMMGMLSISSNVLLDSERVG
jgi:hypothetical protein